MTSHRIHAEDHHSIAADLRAGDIPAPSSGLVGTMVRLLFGLIFAIDAVLKWLPGFRNSYMDNITTAAKGQPSWLHWWFEFWINLQSGAPLLWATIVGLTETALALVLLLGVARRVGYIGGAIYTFFLWGVAEGFGGPYMAGSTDVGTGIVYTMLFLVLLAFAPPARRERFSLDRALVTRVSWWRHLAEPHAVDRVHGAPLVEPVIVGRNHGHDAS